MAIYSSRPCDFCQKSYVPNSSRQKHCSPICRFKSIASQFSGNECWEWPLSINKKTGYGQFMVDSKKNDLISAHRFSYQVFRDEIQDEHYVCHSCDNRSCFNPNHLFLGKPIDNVLDMWKKGRNQNYSNAVSLEDHPNAKLTNSAVKLIRNSTANASKWAKEFGVSKSCINQARRKSTWKDI